MPRPQGIKKKDLENILQFIKEAEGLKTLLRHSWLSTGRRESVAEHSWRLALMAMVISPTLEHPIKLERVLTLVTVHDLCEVYAGDHWAWKKLKHDKHVVEKAGLEKILRSLDKQTAKLIMGLWMEYEEGKTTEANFAKALDKMDALIQHNQASLKTWNKKERDLSFAIPYGDEYCEVDQTLKALKKLINQETKQKVESEV